MIQELPLYVSILFGLTAIGTVLWFYYASKSKTFLGIALVWMILQSALGLSGLYQDAETVPPKIVLFGVLPTLIVIVLMFITTKGQAFIDQIDLKSLTYLHTVRVPVEIVLALLYHQGLVSVYMTYEGTNFDILSGISASIVAFVAFRSAKINRKLLLWWNIICLVLLLNVVITAVFAVPSPFQKISLDQPNVAVLYLPFNLLPTLVVPIVLFAHLTALRQLRKIHS